MRGRYVVLNPGVRSLSNYLYESVRSFQKIDQEGRGATHGYCIPSGLRGFISERM